jgi:glycerol-3-phosphate responsive antiterminator
MKTRKITKNELLKLIRESKHDRFEVIEPVTPETLGQLTSRLRQQLLHTGFLPWLIYPESD